MSEKPIIFSGPMVRAILDGRKTQTRRIAKLPVHPAVARYEIDPKSPHYCEPVAVNEAIQKQFITTFPFGFYRVPYQPGDVLWVKEAFYNDLYFEGPLPKTKPDDWDDDMYYRADGECCQQIPECSCAEVGKPRWRSSRFMPRWASRILLRVKKVRVQRLNEISDGDCRAEGVDTSDGFDPTRSAQRIKWKVQFHRLWDSIHGPGAWEVNPWVWAYTFERQA